MRRGAEEEFQAAPLQVGRGGIRAHERHGVALRGLAGGGAHGAVVAADHGRDLLLGDQPLGLGAPGLRIALVIGIDEPHLGAAEPRQACGFRQRQVELVAAVDDVERGLERLFGVDADLGVGARQRI